MRIWMRAAAAVGLLLQLSSPAAAQQITDEMLQKAAQQTGMSKEQILRIYQSGGALPAPKSDSTSAAPGKTDIPPAESTAVRVPPGTPPASPEPAGARPVAPTRFGADFFKLQPGLFTQSSFGPVPDDYVIGPGDQIVIDVWGEVEFRLERVVDRDGTIILPKGGKILCSGMTLDRVKRAVRERLAVAYSGISLDPDKGTTFLDVTLGKLRAIRVFVIGEAAQPGAYDLSSVATVFTAIYAAGGPSAAGSMRDVRLMRGSQTLARFDLYDYLLKGDRQNDLILREYDTILIPPRGKSVRLAGEVRRPLQFELKEDESLADLLRFGGGFTAIAAPEVLHVQRIVPPTERRHGEPDRTQIDVPMKAGSFEAADPALGRMFDGDSVTVATISDRVTNWVEISGPVKQPGRYEYRPGMDVLSLIELAGNAWPDLLTDRALIDRVAPDGTYQSLHFSLTEVLAGQGAPIPLQTGDQVKLYSLWDVQDRTTVSISGAVRKPGKFDFREATTLHDLILKAGGLSESADSLEAQVSRLRRDAAGSHDLTHEPAQTWEVLQVPLGPDFLKTSQGFTLEPHDAVAIRRLPWWHARMEVVLAGEVIYPGVYTLQRPEERLSEVIAFAGGLKPSAFPPGARITRSKDAIGNVSVDLECALKHADSDCNPVIVDGDTINIPPIPYTVKVMGAVGHPTSLVYVAGKKPGYYVDQAGGYAEGANGSKTQVIYPNGSSRRVHRFRPDPTVLAGSVVFVPEAPPKEKTDYLENLVKITGVMANLITVYVLASRLP